MTTAQSLTSNRGARHRGLVASNARPASAEHPAAASRRTLLGYLVMPRPKDLFKALLMPLTFGIAVLAAGGTTAGTVVRAVVVLAALELLVYPARYQWNDIRGFAADQRHPDEADRGRLPGPVDRARQHVAASTAVAVARIALTAALPLLLPGLELGGILLWVVLGVFGVAAAYEALRAAGTGRTGAVPPPVRPAIVLLWITVGAGYVVRGLTGLALVVSLPGDPALGVAAAVTLWAYGVAFVTARWAIEATAFARLRHGRVVWMADAGHAREHLLALVRWLPSQAGPAESSVGWAALRGRTPVRAPWNLATVAAGAGAAVTGRLLTGPATAAEMLITAAAGGSAALVVVLAPRGRWAAVAACGAVLAGVLAMRHAPAAVVAVLPWCAVLAAYARFSGQTLRTMGELGKRLRGGLARSLLPAGRILVGRDTWDVLRGSVHG
jgi:hypothetical protein